MEVDREKIVRVYSGRPGCGCGCRGKYSDDARNITRVVNVMNSRSSEVKERDGIYFIEDERRNYWAYTSN